MFDKIVSGLVSLSMAIFSSYQGNDAVFSFLYANLQENHITITAELENAFENDFEEIFKTGKSIDIWFHTSVSSKGVVLEEEEFSHNVTYDPLLDSYLLIKGSTNESIVCENYQCLVEELSKIKWHFRRLKSVSDYDLDVYAHLDKIYFEDMDKEFNLMLLWKNKSPRLKERIKLDNARN